MNGLLIVDKPQGVTSHDVVQWARRALSERSIGHAGTLDPMATGVLVLLVGEGTKLAAHLTAASKKYSATLRFGAETDSLDADGEVTERVPEGTPAPRREAIERALAAMVGPIEQVPPAVSAIKVGGVAMHERVRRGETVVLPARSVVLEAAAVTAVREGECDLEMTCSKGFYVRSLARDLARALGTLGHLSALRRTASGTIDLAQALDGDLLRRAAREDPSLRAEVCSSVVPLASLGRWMRVVRVGDADARALGFGQRVACTEPDGTVLVLREDDSPVCVAELSAAVMTVVRGLNAASPAGA